MTNFELYAEIMSNTGNKLFAAEYIREANLPADSVILDYGCGEGSLTRSLATMFPSYTFIGADSSLPMLNLANRIPSRVKFVLADKRNSLIPKADVIILSSVLHEAADGEVNHMEEVMNNIAWYAKPQATIIIRDGYHSESSVMYKLHNMKQAHKFREYLISSTKFGAEYLDTYLLDVHGNPINEPETNEGYICGKAKGVHELLNKLTWGEGSFHREAHEFISFMSLDNWRYTSWLPKGFELIEVKEVKADGYFDYLRRFADIAEVEEWNTHVWVVLKKG